ncbi:terminase small subunit [Ruegeria sp. Ofav3-42]|uniref:terminase small subunit n=1 Tax=Ruegeria sp. Ofav3-42 TaxID=2917759 RepID=UPI001EF6CBC9|nr:terminase small subunit [Ruegeria sp. Ofav3-42]MCG7520856.1 terminase small subunit [Ruegeria sp. Ofav3-42]
MTDETNLKLLDVNVSPELQAMIDRFPLPKGVDDTDVTVEGAAQALGVTVNTVSKWLKATDPGEEPFPAVERGGMGKAYVLRLSHVYAWKCARDADAAKRDQHSRAQVEKLQASFLNLEVDPHQETLSHKDRKALAEADFAYSRAAQARRQLVRLDEVTDLIESIFTTTRDAIEGMPDRLERELSLQPEEVILVDRVGKDVLKKLISAIEKAELEERDLADVEVTNRLLI